MTGIKSQPLDDNLGNNDFQELKKCDIKISINLESISTNFSPIVMKSLSEHHQQGKKIEKEVPFFIPHQIKTCKDEEDNSEKIATLAKELEDWVEDYFGFLLVSGYVNKLVQHGISHIFYVCPFHPVDSLEFKTLACFTIVGGILEDWVVSSKELKKQDANCKAYKSRMEVVEYLTKMLEIGPGSQGLKEIVKSSKSSSLEIMNKEPIVAALYDGLMDIYEMTKQVQPDLVRKQCFAAFRINAMACFQSFQWSQDMNMEEDNYSVETCRYFRQLESSMEGYASMLGLLEGFDLLREEMTSHAVFFKWNDLAAKMIGIQNDVLGFQRDVRNGNEDGIVMKKIKRNGLTPQAAIEEELNLLREYSSDYVNLRRNLIMKFKDEKVVHRYIDIVDSWLYGNFKTFVASQKYGMKNNIEIVHR